MMELQNLPGEKEGKIPNGSTNSIGPRSRTVKNLAAPLSCAWRLQGQDLTVELHRQGLIREYRSGLLL